MAYQTKQTTEHPSKTIVKMVASSKQTGNWPRLMLLYGQEDFLVSWSESYLKDQLTDPAVRALDLAVFSENDQNAYEIIAACETGPLMSERKLVVVEDSDVLSAQAPKDMSADEIADLTAYFPKIPETTLLLFTCKKPNKTKSLYKAIAKHGIVYGFTPLDDATLSGWMNKRLKAAGSTASPSDLISFAKACGYGDPERTYTLYNLENDLKKVFAATDKTQLSFDDFMEYASSQTELNAFKLLDSAFSGRKNDALTILYATIDSQTPSKEMTAIMRFLGLLCSQLEIMVEGKERQEEGQGFYDISSAMKIHEYRLKKAMEACRGKTAAQLRKSLDNAFQIEKDLKNGNIEGRTALELFIAKL